MIKKTLDFVTKNANYLAFTLALGATVASLFLSAVAKLPPCELCWYQRILMFPLPVILGVALALKEKRTYVYVLPFTVLGMLVAFYQSLLQWGIIKENLLECSLSNPCGDPQILWLGFLTIPFGSFLSFAGLTVLMWFARKADDNKLKPDQAAVQTIGKIFASIVVAALAAAIVIQLAG